VWTQRAVIRTIDCAERIWPTPGGLRMALCIARRESNFHARSVNVYSGASGVYQDLPSTWRAFRARSPDNVRWYGIGPDVFNARNAVLLNLRVMHNSGLGPWGGGC
jgi:hypothetical protein